MTEVSLPGSSHPRFARALCRVAVVGVAALSLAAWAGGGSGLARAGMTGLQAEVQRADLRADDRVSLKRALAAGDLPSGKEQRRQLTSEERRALLQDLREVTRDVNQNRIPPRSFRD